VREEGAAYKFAIVIVCTENRLRTRVVNSWSRTEEKSLQNAINIVGGSNEVLHSMLQAVYCVSIASGEFLGSTVAAVARALVLNFRGGCRRIGPVAPTTKAPSRTPSTASH
jgi:hypothetical protein